MQSPSDTPAAATAARIKAWDLPVRLFHWALVLAILSAWVSSEYAEALDDPTLKWHRYNGYAVLVLVVFRFLWGFLGSPTARWSHFLRWPWSAAGYAIDLVRGRDRKFLGHNPLGTYMILALLLAVCGQALLGLFVVEHNETSWGPLYALLSETAQKQVRRWHVAAFDTVILPLVALHIIANTLYGLIKRDPLIRAMITGSKPAADYEDASDSDTPGGSGLRALLALALAVAIVGGSITLLGGKLNS